MRIIHTMPDIDKEASGPTYSVVRLCDALRAVEEDVTLALVGEKSSKDYVRTFPPGLGPKRLGNSPAMGKWLHNEVHAGVDIVHNHSLWMMANVYPGWATKGRPARYVVSPRGTFSKWAMASGSRVKRVFWPLIQKPSIAHAACFHATADAEYQDIRRMGFRQPVAVIPNGIDIPAAPRRLIERPRTLLYFGRLHPVKGLDFLLRAWQKLQDEYPDWNLRIVGPLGDPHANSLMELASSLALKRVSFDGPVYGPEKMNVYASAQLYVLPSHSENFAVTVAEALASGTPAVVSQGAPWQGLEQMQAGWWPPIGYEGLLASLQAALSLPPARLEDMGRNGRLWMEEQFSWEHIAVEMQATYRWLCGKGPLPQCVRLA